jgi:anaerobic selenocysteine-containing dehydrogenase
VTRRHLVLAAAALGSGLAALGPSAVARGLGAEGAGGAPPIPADAATTGVDLPGTHDGLAAVPAGWAPNICTMCASGCGDMVQVQEIRGTRRALKIDGNPLDPFNQGRLCARGQSALRLAYDPHRITQPLIRVAGSRRGEWRFRAASWEEAYRTIRERSRGVQPYETAIAAGWVICAYYRPEVIAFARAMGIPNIYGTPMQPCVTGSHFGSDTVTGNFNIHDEVQADYEHAAYFLSVASNSSVVAISTGRALRFARGLKRQQRVVVLDPRLSELAAHADVWLPVRPGTDLAFILALMHEIVEQGTYEASFLAAHTNAPFLLQGEGPSLGPVMDPGPDGSPARFYVYDQIRGAVVAVPGAWHHSNLVDVEGQPVDPALLPPAGLTFRGRPVQSVFSALRARLQPYTTEWAAGITDLSADTIRQIATEFGTTRPALVEPGWHDGRYRSTVMLRRATAMLQVLVGGIDRPGGWIFSGAYHQAMAEMMAFLRAGGNLADYPPVAVPGIAGPAGIVSLFSDPQAWSHGVPQLSTVWSEQQFAQGKEGVAFPLFPNVGYLEASRGEVQWQGKPYRLRSFWMYQANPVRNAMSAKEWEAFLADPDMSLVVAIDIEPNDSNAYADVILPDQVFIEKEDILFDLGHAHQVGLRMRVPAISPPPHTRSALDILADVAAQQGADYPGVLAELQGWDATAVRAAVAAARQRGGSPTLAIRDYQIARHAQQLHQDPAELAAALRRDGLVVLQQAAPVLERWAMPEKLPVPTPSGRLELFSLMLAGFVQRYGYRQEWDPLITWVSPDWRPGAGEHPRLAPNEFFFAYGKAPVESHTATVGNDLLMALVETRKDQYLGVWVHARPAQALGLKSGDRVRLVNQVDGNTADGIAYVTEMIRPDTVYIMSNFGVRNRLVFGAGRGTALSDVVHARPEPVVGAPQSCGFTVKLFRL